MYKNSGNTKADLINRVVFNLHQIKRLADKFSSGRVNIYIYIERDSVRDSSF